METLLWALGILVALMAGAVGFLFTQFWAHVIKCGHRESTVASLAKDVERMKEDIGTHERGMRGDLHRTTSKCQEHELRITNLERR